MNTAPDINIIREKLKRHFDPENCFVFLFGSRAAGTARYNSDWDIGIISRKPLRGSVLEKAREDLDNIRTLHSFELVDFAGTGDAFKKIAMRHIKPLIGRHE